MCFLIELSWKIITDVFKVRDRGRHCLIYSSLCGLRFSTSPCCASVINQEHVYYEFISRIKHQPPNERISTSVRACFIKGIRFNWSDPLMSDCCIIHMSDQGRHAVNIKTGCVAVWNFFVSFNLCFLFVCLQLLFWHILQRIYSIGTTYTPTTSRGRCRGSPEWMVVYGVVAPNILCETNRYSYFWLCFHLFNHSEPSVCWCLWRIVKNT